MLKLIQPISKKDQVVAAIKEAILLGTIGPGDQIVESRMARQLGSGIPLVREALIALEHQGFVQKTPYKGTTVTKLDPRQIQDIFQLRVELEALAVEWAKANVTPVDIKQLRSLIDNMEQAASELDLDRFYQNDLDWHRKVWALSGNTYLNDVLERLVVPLFAFFVVSAFFNALSIFSTVPLAGVRSPCSMQHKVSARMPARLANSTCVRPSRRRWRMMSRASEARA